MELHLLRKEVLTLSTSLFGINAATRVSLKVKKMLREVSTSKPSCKVNTPFVQALSSATASPGARGQSPDPRTGAQSPLQLSTTGTPPGQSHHFSAHPAASKQPEETPAHHPQGAQPLPVLTPKGSLLINSASAASDRNY